MNRLVAPLLASASLLVAGQAFPCGAPFGTGVKADPKQAVLLAHKGDQETYVFQPTFCGDVKDFGVILPVPSLLSAAPALADAAMFDAASAIAAPTVVKKTECRSRGGGLDAGMGSFGDASDGTTVVASGKVGFLDWVQLEAKDEASFTSWLEANGYPYEAKAKAAFDYYVAKKWYFVAFKVSNGATPPSGMNCKSLGPVALQFTTATPVLPSRIATVGGAASGGFSWRVFAITDGKDQMGFDTGFDWTQKKAFSGIIPTPRIGQFGGLAIAGDRLTELTVTFDGARTADVGLKKEPAVDYRETVNETVYVDCADPAVDDAGSSSGTGFGCATHDGKSAPTFAVGVALVGLALSRRRR